MSPRDARRALLFWSLMVVAGVAVAVWQPFGGATRAVGGPAISTFADVIARTDPSIVHVTVRTGEDRPAASRDDEVGAGFVVGAGGWIITSRHTLQGARRVFADLDGRGVFEAKIVGVDDATDVAVLKIAAEGLRVLPAGDVRSLRKGDWVLAAGSPFRLPRSWSAGIVSGLSRTGVGVRLRGYEDFIQTDAAANVGNSGGPLMDTEGRVVGMMTAILSRSGRSEGVGLAVPIDVVLETARRLMAGETVRRPSLGVVVREMRRNGAEGLEVTRFQTESPGRDAGLQVGDLLLQVDGVATPRASDLQRVLWRSGGPPSVVVIFERRGQRLQTTARVR